MAIGIGIILITMYMSLTSGTFDITVQEVIRTLLRIDRNPDQDLVIFEFRLPRIIIAVLVGMGLGIAGSPSIHWNERFILEEEKHFESRLKNEQLHVDVLIGVGELEKNHKSRLYDNAKELSERLVTLASRGVHVEFKESEEEGHISVLPVLINRALRFTLGSAAIQSSSE